MTRVKFILFDYEDDPAIIIEDFPEAPCIGQEVNLAVMVENEDELSDAVKLHIATSELHVQDVMWSKDNEGYFAQVILVDTLGEDDEDEEDEDE